MNSYQQAVRVLPEALRVPALEVEPHVMERVEEVRLRIGQRPTFVLPEGERPVPGGHPVCTQELEQLVQIAGRWSLHAVQEQLRRGFLTVEGGHRLGLCGTVVAQGGTIHHLRDISGANLRIARQIRGIAEPVVTHLGEQGLKNTLILGPPGAGKTTLLRELIRCISAGEGTAPFRVAVADERGELAATWNGVPQMDLGKRTDVMDGGAKGITIPLLLRGMRPQVIAVDEITQQEDIEAMEQVVGCGVVLLATPHGSGMEDLKRRPLYREVLDCGLFDCVVVIGIQDKQRTTNVIKMGE